MKKQILVLLSVILVILASLSCTNPGKIRTIEEDIEGAKIDTVDYNTPAVKLVWNGSFQTNPNIMVSGEYFKTWTVVGAPVNLDLLLTLEKKRVIFRYRSIDEEKGIVLVVFVAEIPNFVK